MKITVKKRKTTAKEKVIGGIVWGILIGCIGLNRLTRVPTMYIIVSILLPLFVGNIFAVFNKVVKAFII